MISGSETSGDESAGDEASPEEITADADRADAPEEDEPLDNATTEAGTPGGVPGWQSQIDGIERATRELADASSRYHTRAQQREGVIDHLRSEVETLRQGERRGLLRPVLAEMCRLRDDLAKQAATLPPDFDALKAAELLRSYAETIELTLEDNGVVTFTPDSDEPFNPRMHRRVSGEPNADPARAGRIAAVRRDGYLDIEANSPIAPAEVTVFAAPQTAPMTGDQDT